MSEQVEQDNTIDSTNVDMAKPQQSWEQITKVPTTPPEKIKVKDPKKIAAGKKLAAYNKKAKAKQKLIQDEEVVEEDNSEKNYAWPEIGITSLIAIVGLGLSGIDLFFRYKNQYQKEDSENKNENSESYLRRMHNEDDEIYKKKEIYVNSDQISGME